MNRLIIILLLLFFFLNAWSKTIRVGKAQVYITIQAALKVAVDGDTILVDAGHYHEGNLLVQRSISLIGINHPILDGDHKYEVISVKADRVLVQGFKIIHSGVSSIEDFAGIKIYNRHHVIILDNILEDTFFGIYTQYGTNCIIKNNRLTSYSTEEQQSGNGIHCWKSDSMQIIANTINGHRDGIYFEFVTHSVIWRNISQNNLRYGLHFMFSNSDAYYSNVFAGNGAGVAVMFSKEVTMENNYFEENWGDGSYGLLLKEISNSTIYNNRFVKNTTGIFMEGVSRVQLEKNVFKENGWAMKIQASCMEVAVSKNNFLSNTFDVGTNGSLVLNTFANNYWDKYEGYDLDKDKLGDIPYRPVSMYAMIIEQNPPAMILFRSFMSTLLDKTEKILPSLTPEDLKDDHPFMKPLTL
ncbi:MAG: nitrous oxide reductase family maturation protein NosD [Chitinophagaceae bacterium]|nr:nitrous oxide reductase family maturation protein NosD [Chitinophagaceae bacterium]